MSVYLEDTLKTPPVPWAKPDNLASAFSTMTMVRRETEPEIALRLSKLTSRRSILKLLPHLLRNEEIKLN